jgi:hypothetical protein
MAVEGSERRVEQLLRGMEEWRGMAQKVAASEST